MVKMKTEKGYTTTLINERPIPGTVKDRNGDFRVWLPAGKPWSLQAIIDGEIVVIAGGIAEIKPDKKFCLQIRTRVTDDSEEPIEIPAEIL